MNAGGYTPWSGSGIGLRPLPSPSHERDYQLLALATSVHLLVGPDPLLLARPWIGFHEHGAVGSHKSNLQPCATDAAPLPGRVAVPRSSPTWETNMTSRNATSTSSEDFWRAIREAEREADRVDRPSVMESFRDWAQLDGHSYHEPAASTPPRPRKG